MIIETKKFGSDRFEAAEKQTSTDDCRKRGALRDCLHFQHYRNSFRGQQHDAGEN